MDRPADSQRPAAPAPPPKSLRTQYLTLYNLASAVLWLRAFYRVVLILAIEGGWENVFAGADETVRIVQTAAVLEIGHAALGELVQRNINAATNTFLANQRSHQASSARPSSQQ